MPRITPLPIWNAAMNSPDARPSSSVRAPATAVMFIAG
jgi:hypothetical protein